MQSPVFDNKNPVLVFDTPIAIVGGGTTDPDLLRQLAERGIKLIAADGGADAIGAAGLVPEAIIGDLDSITDRAAWEKKTKVIHIPEQITTDFQKALYSTKAPATLALGMAGRRLDHTLSALSAISQIAPERPVLLVDEVDVALAISGPFRFSAQPNERVSVHPLLPVSFERSAGLFYPLDGLTLEPLGMLGTSNHATGGTVEIVPQTTTPWLLLLGVERLWDLLDSVLAK